MALHSLLVRQQTVGRLWIDCPDCCCKMVHTCMIILARVCSFIALVCFYADYDYGVLWAHPAPHVRRLMVRDSGHGTGARVRLLVRVRVVTVCTCCTCRAILAELLQQDG